ncbi:hypothetical protein HP532_04940 [Pseudomonas sp. CrR25]|nr:hypothetical protein [Pseudomonas sp. CrR25]
MHPRIILVAAVLSLGTGCATALNSQQKAELDHYEARGMGVQEKNPAAGAALGLLPGGGSFYGREYGFGVVNLLFWPLSIFWDPISGYDASRSINYQATKAHVTKLQEREMLSLDDQLGTGELDLAQYTLEKRKVERKYRYF